MSEDIVVSTKDRPGTMDAIETAKPGEPLFTLQGGDPLAPTTIMFWANLARTAALAERNRDKAHHMLRKASIAEAVAWAFQDYQRGEGDEAEAAAEAAAAAIAGDELKAALAKLADKLHNALAEANDVAEALGGLGTFEDPIRRIGEAVLFLKRAANDIEPRRHLRVENDHG